MTDKQTFLVVGAGKTATSSVVALLNTHPEVFCLYETDLTHPVMTKYGRQLLEVHPQLRAAFGPHQPMVDALRRLNALVRENGGSHRLIGDKILFGLTGTFLEEISSCRLIYCSRDLGTWLAKNSTDLMYKVSANVVPAAVDFTTNLLAFHLHPIENRFLVRMEDFLCVDSRIPGELCAFLELDWKAEMATWWESAGPAIERDSFKAAQKWLGSHASSSVAPSYLDTQANRSRHEFWDAIQPIFDRYYKPAAVPPAREEVLMDMERLREIRSKYQVSKAEAFEDHSTGNLKVSPAGPVPRAVEAFKRIVRAVRS